MCRGEGLGNAGFDLVYSSVSYALPANVDHLVLLGSANLSGTGNALANIIFGNMGDNALDGGVGVDTMIGGMGNETYFVDNPGDVITDEVRDRLRGSAVLLPIMSPSYVTSNWCDWELKKFMQLTRDDSPTIGNKSRIIKVVKLPGDDDHYSEMLSDVKAAAFFVRKPEGHAVELVPGSEAFSEALDLLAASIAGILRRL